MSIPNQTTINCSKCGAPFDVIVFESVNTEYSSDVAKRIINGDLFNAKCPKCGFTSHMEYDTLYHDMNHNAMIWVLHENSPNHQSRIDEIRSSNIHPYETLRIVHSMNALREKVACLENKRDDRIIELCKVFIVYTLLNQQPDFNFQDAFYSTNFEKEFILLYGQDGKQLTWDLTDDIYDKIGCWYSASPFVMQFDNNYPIVDYAWAEGILPTLIQAEAKKLDKQIAEEVENRPVNEQNHHATAIICPACNQTLPDDSVFCQYCGSSLSKNGTVKSQISAKNEFTSASQNKQNSKVSTSSHNSSRKPIKDRLVTFSNVLTIILSVIAIISIILALNLQDSHRNTCENWNTTAIYIILISLFSFVGITAIYSLYRKTYKILPYTSSSLLIAVMVFWAEGSIYSSTLNNRHLYINSELINTLNTAWTVAALMIAALIFLCLACAFFEMIRNKWYASIKYREKCYQRAAKVNDYFKQGIISQEEYEKTREAIFKNFK